jgi:hypothetical protein
MAWRNGGGNTVEMGFSHDGANWITVTIFASYGVFLHSTEAKKVTPNMLMIVLLSIVILCDLLSQRSNKIK